MNEVEVRPFIVIAEDNREEEKEKFDSWCNDIVDESVVDGDEETLLMKSM